MTAKSPQEYEKLISDRGFSKVSSWTDKPDAYYEPHAHKTSSTILVVSGQLTILFPDDPDARKATMKPGDMVDIDPGRLHEVWIGPDGCTTVNGE